MALKEINSLKKGDKFFATTPSGTAAFASWAEVLAVETLVIYTTIGSAKRREILEVEFKFINSKKNGEIHKIYLNPTDKISVPDRPNKVVRVLRELMS